LHSGARTSKTASLRGREERALTAGETAKLENQQKGINQQVKADRSANGGKLATGEKKQINGEQNAASKNIYTWLERFFAAKMEKNCGRANPDAGKHEVGRVRAFSLAG
jgi:hypothetical protein